MFQVDPFYHKTIRKYNYAFSSLFNDVKIRRFDTDDTTVLKTIRVPIAFGPKEKYLLRLNNTNYADMDETDFRMMLPRMSFEMPSFNYDPVRASKPETKLRYAKNSEDPEDEGNAVIYQYAPAPWNFNFRLNVMARYIEDGLQIMEQILPFFEPDIHMSLKNIHGLGLTGPTMDAQLILDSVTNNYEYEGPMATGRVLTWQLDFTLKAWLFKPVSEADVIKKVIVEFFDFNDTDKNTVQQRITVEVDPPEAEENEDYDIITTIEEFPE